MNKGIIIVNKPINYTSRDVVNVIGKVLNTKKIGHTGTLDPIATGVLVVCFGKYTKLVNVLTSLDKEYIAEIKLGIKTDTLDITGNIIEQKDFSLTKEEIEKVLNSFKGLYHMEIPLYSAKRVNGKKLYEYARKGEDVILPFKDVHIYDIALLDFKDDIIKFKVKVEKGTFIRSLIKDICTKLNTIGTMNNLIRVKQGKFSLENAYTLEDIKNNNYQVLNINDVLDITNYELKELEYLKVKNGNKIKIDINTHYVLFKYQTKEIAIYQKENDFYKCFIMLTP